MFKLELGPTGQFASRGNVCIFPQDPSPLGTCLPPPLSQLHDEVCVIFIGSPDIEVTIEMLSRSPLLVRRSRIIEALKWLIQHNSLYSDLNIDLVEEAAAHYPEAGIPIPIQSIIRVNTNSEGASYTQQANSEQFNQNVSPLGMPSSTVIDADHADSTYKMRKLNALQRLKAGQTSFIKYPSGSTPLPTRHSPDTYGHLWPTLFPYGSE
ncbi:hypothetical protein BDP27DRAFT_1235039 [Rhodocollybia butyracea]|uniref:DUF6570 domain-containing protein n=1 Tax=Rhodocollybia butyracea TaxID=206335 RepID=A0A9P5PCY5_9AGAR|nr:hypothetical protein BDP27DRAFT_1235039 [Rhodocollybia butyracea]